MVHGKYIDLHLHLDGAFTVEIVKKLADVEGIPLAQLIGDTGKTDADALLKRQLTVPESCASLNEFLQCFTLPLKLLQTETGISEAVYLAAENIRAQGVIYAELRFAPQLSTERGLTQEAVVRAALDGLKRTRLHANLILCCMRGQGNAAENAETVRLAGKYLVEDGGVVAVDLAGAEGLFPTADYRELFATVKRAGIPFTIHAGEAAGADSVRLAAEYGASRIGHGVRMAEDPAVLNYVKEKGIYLEMCPTSNFLTKAVPDMSNYPLMDYLKQGIRVTINTDDMGIEDTTIAGEFDYIRQLCGLTEEQALQILLNAVDGAFTSEKVKQALRTELLQKPAEQTA